MRDPDGPDAHRVLGRARPPRRSRRGRLAAGGLDPALDEACRRIRLATGAALVGIWERRPGGLVPRATDVEGPGITARRAPARVAPCSRSPSSPRADPRAARDAGPAPARHGDRRARRAHPGGESPWGILVLAGAMVLGPDDGTKLAGAIARTLGVLIRGASATEQATSRLRRSEALRRVATDLASRLDVGDVVRDLSDHARVLFGADRVAVVLRDPEGRISSPGGTGFSDAFLAIARDLEESRTGSRDIPPRRPVLLLGPDAPRSASPVRAAAVQEGVDTPPRGAARRRPRAPWRPVPRPRPAAPLARGRPRRRRGARRRCRDRRPVRADVRADGRVGRPAPVDPAARRAPLGPHRRPADRPRDRHRAAPAHRLRERPRLPGPRRDLVPVAMQGPGAVYADENPDQLSSPSARASRAGSPGSASRSSSTTRPTTRGRSRSRVPRRTSTSRCSSPRWSTRACAWASSS